MERSIKGYFSSGIRVKETGEKPAVMRYIRVAVLLCFIVGIISANMMDKEQVSDFGIWNTYFIEKFKYVRIQPMELFWYVFETRMPMMVLLLLLAVTDWGTIAGAVFLSWQGFAGGFLMAAAVIAYGIRGIVLIGTAIFPQYFLYIPLYIVYIYLAEFLKGRMRVGSNTEMKRTKIVLLFLSVCMLILSIYIAGIFLESYVNPYFLKKILKIF